jgi:potassium efflux system protein
LLALGLAWAAASAAPPAPSAPAGASSLSRSLVESRLKDNETSTAYDAETKKRLTELYNRTLAYLETARTNNAAAEIYNQTRSVSADEAAQLRRQLERDIKANRPVTVKVTDKTPLADIEQMLLKEKADAAAVQAKVDSIEDLLTQEKNRPEEARQQLTEARKQLDICNGKLKQPAGAGDIVQITEARRWSLQAQSQALTGEINMLDQELLSQPTRVDLMKAQLDTARHSLERINERVRLLENILNERRRDQVEAARAEVESAQGETRDKPPLVQAFAAQNADYSNQLQRMTERLEETVAAAKQAADSATRVEDEYHSTQQKLEVAGLSRALGQILLEQRRLLPDVRKIRREARLREARISDTAFNQIQLNEQLRKLQNLDSYVSDLSATLNYADARAIHGDLVELAKTRRDLLGKVVTTGDSYLRALGELDYAQTRLLNVVSEYDHFLAERLLWVRSSPAPDIAMLLKTPAQVMELLAPGNWLGVLYTLADELQASFVPAILLLMAVILLVKKRRIVQVLQETGKRTVKVRTDRFRYTLEALGLTALLALPWPLIVWTAGWMLTGSLEAGDFSRAVGRALIVMSPAFLYLSAFRALCRSGGVAEAHYRWPENSTRRLRRQITVLMAIFLPSAIIAIITFHATTQVEGALARLAFVVFVGALSYFFYRLLGPKEPILQAVLQQHPNSTLARYRYLWLVLALILPILLIVLAVTGFLYTAGTLTGSLIQTLWLVLGFLVVQQTAVRWLLLIRRKLALEAALERRRAAQIEQRKETSTEAAVPHDETEIEVPAIDLAALNQESVKLLNSAMAFGMVIGLWFIWSDVLPAFGRLDHIELWHYKGVVAGEESLLAVTVADVLLALLITLISVVATRRFPALMEIVLLKRFEISPAGRYTAATLARYIIAAVGILLVLKTIGVRWSQIQWMAAALSVGIGFGLQEIVANFISGLIILFERPVRVGDVVSVGESDGVVTRIQIRATTIRTWDRQELLVPNKEFITGRLLNWSLSDPITRVRVPVGVAYGSNVQQAMRLMRETAEANKLVLSEPAPYTLFTQFGDNTLNLELRCFIGNQDDRLPAISQLHEAIDQRFKESGIVIAFPQRDVHLDTSQPLDVRIHPNDRATPL